MSSSRRMTTHFISNHGHSARREVRDEALGASGCGEARIYRGETQVDDIRRGPRRASPRHILEQNKANLQRISKLIGLSIKVMIESAR